MKYCSLILFVPAMFLGTASGARAEFIRWSYDWAPNQIAVGADPGGTGGIVMTNEPAHHAQGAATILATELRTFSSASASRPDRFTKQPYSLRLLFTDDASHRSIWLTFRGYFNGFFSLTSAHITNAFTGLTSQTFHLGHVWYTVRIGPYVAPGIPDAVAGGRIEAYVTARPNPEPSTLILTGAALTSLTVIYWRKRGGRATANS